MTYTGFRLDDDSSVIDLSPEGYTETDLTTDSGEYNILLKGGSDDNYDFVFIPGTLTITRLEIQQIFFTQDFDGLVYGDTVELKAYSNSGLPVEYILEDDASAILETDDVGGSARHFLTLLTAGEVRVSAAQAGDDVYFKATNVIRAIPVGKRPLIITLNLHHALKGWLTPNSCSTIQVSMVMTLQMTLILYQQPFLMRRPPVLPAITLSSWMEGLIAFISFY